MNPACMLRAAAIMQHSEAHLSKTIELNTYKSELDGSCRMYRRPGARYDSERIKDDIIITLHRPNLWGNS